MTRIKCNFRQRKALFKHYDNQMVGYLREKNFNVVDWKQISIELMKMWSDNQIKIDWEKNNFCHMRQHW